MIFLISYKYKDDINSNNKALRFDKNRNVLLEEYIEDTLYPDSFLYYIVECDTYANYINNQEPDGYYYLIKNIKIIKRGNLVDLGIYDTDFYHKKLRLLGLYHMLDFPNDLQKRTEIGFAYQKELNKNIVLRKFLKN